MATTIFCSVTIRVMLRKILREHAQRSWGFLPEQGDNQRGISLFGSRPPPFRFCTRRMVLVEIERIKIFIIVAVTAVLVGCSTTFPVTGSISRTGEKFIGTATSVLAGKSSIEMTTENGIKCSGEYEAPIVWSMTEGASFNGTVSCDDGRKGTFHGTGTSVNGQGFGKMTNGDKFQFVYGHTSRIYKER
ncbi:MAG: hypothetical protein AB7G80_06805 [Dongiaceae bacterium]